MGQRRGSKGEQIRRLCDVRKHPLRRFPWISETWQMEVLTTDTVFQKVAGLYGFPVQSTISRFLYTLKIRVAREIAMLNLYLLMMFRHGFKAFRVGRVKNFV